MKVQFLENPQLNFIIFGGKGGSGKTTSACAAALYLSQKYKDKKILVVTTDPAPSVGDSFDIEVGNKITQIEKNIWAQEFDAKELLEDFRSKHLMVLKTILDRGTYLDQEDIKEFVEKPLPGMDEIMAIIKIADLLQEEKYHLIILDTAPTGHTKILLSLPATMKKWLEVADLMLAKHRFMSRQIQGRYLKDECDVFLEKTLDDIKRVEMLLKNQMTTEFVPVTILEPMSILETQSFLEYLKNLEIKVQSIIVNKVVSSQPDCSFCNARLKGKEKYLEMIERQLKDYQIIKMPLFPTEVRGKVALNEYAQILFGQRKFEITLPKITQKFSKIQKGKMADLLNKDVQVIMCGGKGGVGKTSMAAATGIAFAKKYKNKKVLITTTDPAQALSNIFAQNIPLDTPVAPIKGFNNLFALEIDAQKELQDFKKEYQRDVEKFFTALTGPNIELVYDKQVIRELMELSPPGLEELMALGKIADFIKAKTFDIYVLDSAASGHLLRFLELPVLIRDWLKSIFKILRKYQKLNVMETAQKVVNISRNIRYIQEILFNPLKTEFIMITILEEMGRRETNDLAQALEKLHLNFNYIIANFVQPENRCNFCLAKRKNQEHYLNIIKKQYPEKNLIPVPVFKCDVRGMSSLKNLAQFLYGI